MSEFIKIGKIGKPHGVKGNVYADWYIDECPFEIGSEITLEKDGVKSKVVLKGFSQSNDRVLLKIEGINDRDKASTLTHSDVLISIDELPKLPDGEHYIHEYWGIKVIDEDGNVIGEITDVYPTGSNDVYEVKTDSDTVLIPSIDSIVKNIDFEKKIMTIHVVDGLLEKDE